MRKKPIILILEDDSGEVDLCRKELLAAGIECDLRSINTRQAYIEALDICHPDLILSEYQLPALDGLSALKLAQEKYPDSPFIFVTDSIWENAAIEAIRFGATDYILKDQRGRFVTAVRRAFSDRKARLEHRHTVDGLKCQLGFHDLVSENLASLANCQENEISDLIVRLLGQTARFSGADYAFLIETDAEREKWLSLHEWRSEGMPYRGKPLADLSFASLPWASEKLGRGEMISLSSSEEIPAEAAEERKLWTSTGIEALLMTPFHDREGRLRGMSGLISLQKEHSWDQEDRTRIGLISGIMVNALDRKQREREIGESVVEKETLLRELYHRTNNNMQMICAMLELEMSRESDDRVGQVFRSMENQIQSMGLVHSMLYRTRNLSCIDLKDYIVELVTRLKESYRDKTEGLDFVMDLENAAVTIDVALPFGLVLNELITNIIKHAFPKKEKRGIIRLAISRNRDSGEIDALVKDDGIGLPIGFDVRRQGGIGLECVFGLIESQLRGKIEVENRNGLEFRIRFSPDCFEARV